MRNILILLSLFGAPYAYADWTLDNQRSLFSFVTIKAQDVAEVHTFTELSGGVADSGEAAVAIDLASIDTRIPIRDERMRELLFQSDRYPEAMATTQLDLTALLSLAPGESMLVSAEIVITLHEAELPITADLMVSRIATDRMLVATARPIIINAASVALAQAVEQLREIAGLPSISKAVPVTFVLQFVADPET